MATISANVSSADNEKLATLAFIKKQSKRNMAGEAIRDYLQRHREALRRGIKLSSFR